MKWDNLRDARNHLTGGSFLDKDGDLCVVEDVWSRGAKYMASVYYVNKDDHEEPVDVPLDQLDLRPFKLGYVQVRGGEWVHTIRVSKRRWKLGLDSGNVREYHPSNTRTGYGKLRSTFRSYDWESTARNRYPKYSELPPEGGAFHRDLMLNREGALHYRGKLVGIIDDGDFTLLKRNKFLQKLIEKEMSK